MNTTFDVRIEGIVARKGKRRTSYVVRWRVAGRRFQDTFNTKALAESERSKLIIAAREGIAFDVESGLPEPVARKLNSRTWLEAAMEFVDTRWPRWSPKHRRNTATALASITLTLLTVQRRSPSDDELRKALHSWAFGAVARPGADGKRPEVPPEHRPAMEWLSGHVRDIGDLNDSAVISNTLDRLAVRLDGKPASASTINRNRAALSGALRFAVGRKWLLTNPLASVDWEAPKSDAVIDRRTVVNPRQATALISAAGKIMPDLEAFYGCLYYASMRPEEVKHLKEWEYIRPKAEGLWGWFELTGASVEVAPGWGDHQGATEDRALKHRPANAVRRVPVAPALVKLLDSHIERFGVGEDGRIFVSRRGPGGRYLAKVGHPVTSSTYARVWQLARAAVLTEAQRASPLAKRPYDLRHAGVSLWLNAGVPATQVADWAGHSVNVLLRVYAKCIDGGEEAAIRRIAAALTAPAE